jgi:hypothetical protein
MAATGKEFFGSFLTLRRTVPRTKLKMNTDAATIEKTRRNMMLFL